MTPFRTWSLGRVASISGCWLIVVTVYCGWQLFRDLLWIQRESNGNGPAAVTFSGWRVLALALVPPAVLLAAWLFVRRARP